MLVAENGEGEGAPGFSVVPEDYEQLEAQLVPSETRLAPKYSGCYFVFVASDVGDALEPML